MPTTNYKLHQRQKVLKFAERYSPVLPYAIPPKSRRVYLKCAHCPAQATHILFDELFCAEHANVAWWEQWEDEII